MTRRRLLPLALALLLGALAMPARATPAISDLTGPLDTDADLAAALDFEAKIPEHTFYGMVVPLLWDPWPHLDPDAQPIQMMGEGDSGNYTGVYLAAQSWRYAQAKHELAQLGTDPLGDAPHDSEVVAFWRAQRDEALERAREMVGYYHLLVNISKYWETEFDPQLYPFATEDGTGWIDYGGGIVPGEAGHLMRTCTPEDPSPAFADVRYYWSTSPYVIGPLRWEDGRDWYCLAHTSRDSYMGTLFGLGVALDYLGAENPGLRATLAHDLMAMADYAVKYAWNQPRPHGYVANPITSNDLVGPISPLFIQVPLSRLHLVQNARHAAKLIGHSAGMRRFEALWQSEVASNVLPGQLFDSMVIDSMSPHNAYYKFQLHLMAFFNVIRLEPDPLVRTELARAMGVLDASLTDDGNPFFEAMTYALTHEQQRLDEAVPLHREYLDYIAFHEDVAANGTPPFNHSARCSITTDPGPDAPVAQQPLECRPRDEVNLVQPLPSGDELFLPFRPGTDSRPRAKDPLPVGVRRLADFLWQKDPTILYGDWGIPWRGHSIDFLGTYWMLRYYSEVETADAQPLPEWLGPRFE